MSEIEEAWELKVKQAIAEGYKIGVEEEREAILKIAKEESRPTYEKGTDWGDGYIAALEFMIHQIRARGNKD